MTTQVDATALSALADRLAAARAQLVPAAAGVVKKGANNIKRDAAARSAANGNSAQGRAINYLIQDDGLTAIIGYRKGGAGSMGHWAEFGVDPTTATKAMYAHLDEITGGEDVGISLEFGAADFAPQPALIPAAEAEAERIPAWLAKALRGLV